MNKKDLVKYVSDSVMITASDAGVIIDVLFQGIKEKLEDGEEVKIRDFGTFFLQSRKPRIAYSPIDHRRLEIPAKKVIKFKASKKLIERIKNNG